MPKMRTRKVTAKRFKVTKTGKLVHRTPGARHIRASKNKAHQRRQDSPKTLTNSKFIRKIKRFLAI